MIEEVMITTGIGCIAIGIVVLWLFAGSRKDDQ